jgi:hypothetical protein
MNNFIFCKFLNDIPPRFRLNSAEKNNFGSDFDKNDKKFIVSFVSVFNVNCRIVCETFGISVTSLNRWKAEFSSKIDPLDLLRDPSPVSTAEAVAVQWEPTVSADPPEPLLPQQGKRETGVGTDAVLYTDADTFTDNQIFVSMARKARKPFEDLGDKSRSLLLKAATNNVKNYFFNDLLLVSSYSFTDKQIIFSQIIRSLVETMNYKFILTKILATFSATLTSLIKEKKTTEIIRLLSLLYPSFTRSEASLSLQIPISQYLWTKVHKHCLTFGPGRDQTILFKQTRATCSMNLLRSTVSWLFAQGYFKPLAFGVHSLKDSQNIKHTLPNYIRIPTKIKIFNDYHFAFSSKRLSKVLLYKLLNIIGKSNDKLLSALDTFSCRYGDGTFLLLREFIPRIVVEEKKQTYLLSLASSIQLFLKYNYKTHLSENSTEICSNFPYLFGEINLPQKTVCKDCSSIMKLFSILINTIDELSMDYINLHLRPNSKENLK